MKPGGPTSPAAHIRLIKTVLDPSQSPEAEVDTRRMPQRLVDVRTRRCHYECLRRFTEQEQLSRASKIQSVMYYDRLGNAVAVGAEAFRVRCTEG